MSETETTAAADPEPEEAWEEEIPPRRRLLTPLTGCLVVALVLGLGFLGGILVQKHLGDGGGGSGPRGARSALAASAAAGGGAAVRLGGGPGAVAAGGVASGEVKVIDGSTLYLTEASGATVRVSTSAATSVTESSEASVRSIHPGDSIVVQGERDASGALRAERISLGDAGLLPAAAAGAGGPGGAFASCLEEHGVELPSAAPSGGRLLLDRSDPKLRSALEACRELSPLAQGRGAPATNP